MRARARSIIVATGCRHIWWSTLQIADMLSMRPDIDGQTRRFLQNWRAREKLRLFVHQCRAGHWRDAAALLLGAGLMDPLWFFRIVTSSPSSNGVTGGTIRALKQVVVLRAPVRETT